MTNKFNCEGCGACCKVIKCNLLSSNDRCMIYETRPDVCNVEKCYHKYCSYMDWNDFEKMTKEYCIKCRELVKENV